MRMIGMIVVASITSLLSFACSDDGDSTNGTAGVTSTIDPNDETKRSSTGSVAASKVSELGLTGSLSINLPAAIKETSASLALTEGSKSIEACLMKESANQLVTQITMASNILCHIEAEGENIPWNKGVLLDTDEIEGASLRLSKEKGGLKLLNDPMIPDDSALPDAADSVDDIASSSTGPSTDVADVETDDFSTDITDGESSTDGMNDLELPEGGSDGEETDFGPKLIGIYADGSEEDSVTVYVCEGDDQDSLKLTQSFSISGSKDLEDSDNTAAKGEININMGDDTFGTFQGAIHYDNKFTNADTSATSMEVKFDGSGFSFAQRFSLTEKDSGVYRVSISDVGTMTFGSEESSFKSSGIGLFDADHGNVFYNYTGFGDPFATHACVDSSSILVDCEQTKFQQGGDLYVTKDDVPKILPSDFSPAEPSGFDCSTAEWTALTLSTDADVIAKHDACDATMDELNQDGGGMGDCFSGDGYAQSSNEEEITFEEGDQGDFEPEFDVDFDDELDEDVEDPDASSDETDTVPETAGEEIIE